MYLAVSLLFPALQKLKKRRSLYAYYSQLFAVRPKIIKVCLGLLCGVELALAGLTSFAIFRQATGIALISVFIVFAAYRVYLLIRYDGGVSCGCTGNAGSSTRAESVGGLAGTGVLAVSAILWTII